MSNPARTNPPSGQKTKALSHTVIRQGGYNVAPYAEQQTTSPTEARLLAQLTASGVDVNEDCIPANGVLPRTAFAFSVQPGSVVEEYMRDLGGGIPVHFFRNGLLVQPSHKT